MKYIHPTLWREAYIKANWLYKIHQDKNTPHLRDSLDKNQIIALWFQPVEEEKEIDWIDEAYSEFVLKPWDIRHEDKSKSMFRESIEKYMPKQYFSDVTRFEVIDNHWRVYVSKWVSIIQSIQDDWRTLKIFVDWRWGNPQEELIPLDVDKCFIEIRNRLLNTWLKLDNTKEEFIKQILSKYGTTPQKKFNRAELEEWYKFHEDFVNWMCFDEAIEHFLATNHLLEE